MGKIGLIITISIKLTLVIFIGLLTMGCKKVQIEEDAPVVIEKNYNLIDSVAVINDTKITFFPRSSQVVMSNDNTNKLFLYYNVIKRSDSQYVMGQAFKSLIHDKKERLNGIKIRTSKDGLHWSTHGLSPIFGYNSSSDLTQTVESCIAWDHYTQEYIMCFNDNKMGMFVSKSKDLVRWSEPKLMVNFVQDTQYSIVVGQNNYLIYCRAWVGDPQVRSLAVRTLKKNFSEISNPNLVLKSQYPQYPHIYNPAITQIKPNKLISFGTFYNDENKNVAISPVIIENNKSHFIEKNFLPNFEIQGQPQAQFIIVSPGLIPTEKENQFWLYYLIFNNKHNHINNETKTVYARIKIMIE